MGGSDWPAGVIPAMTPMVAEKWAHETMQDDLVGCRFLTP